MLNNKQQFAILIFVLYISSRPPFLMVNVAIVLLFLYMVILHHKYNVDYFDKYTVLLLFTYPIITLFYYINFGTLEIFLTIRFFILLILSVWIIKFLKFNYLNVFEKCLYFLAIISLIFYPLQLILPQETLNLISELSDLIPLNEKNEEMKSIFVWSMDYDAGFRNTGFPWEPKAYANFLIIGIIIRLVQNKMNFKDRRIIVYILALLTTISTTGYLIFFGLIPAFVLWNKSLEKFFKYVIPVSLIMIYVMQLDFMWEKIKAEWEGRYGYQTLLSDSRTFNKRSLGRTPSMMVDIMDFLKQPILGFGMQKDLRTQSVYTKLVRVNGLSDWIASFGIVGILLFIFGHFYGFKKYLASYNYSGAFILLIIISVIYFATTVTTHLFWLCLMFLFIVPNNNYSYKSKYYEINRM